MAANWRDIADSELDPESPVTTSLAQAWRDNPEGIAAGVSGAPRIQEGAYGAGSFPPSALKPVSAGSVVRARNDNEYSLSGWDRQSEWIVGSRGNIRVYAEHKKDSNLTGDSELRITKNGSVVASWSTSSESYVSRSHDFSVEFGDTVRVEGAESNGNSTFVRRGRVQTDGGVPMMLSMLAGPDDGRNFS